MEKNLIGIFLINRAKVVARRDGRGCYKYGITFCKNEEIRV